MISIFKVLFNLVKIPLLFFVCFFLLLIKMAFAMNTKSVKKRVCHP